MTQIVKDSEVDKIRQDGVVLVGGCFDIIHPAHLKFLKLSKKLGQKLVILLESDENIKKIKGSNRPLNNQNVRAENLSKLSYVDHIILLRIPGSSEYYYNLVKNLEPDIIAVTTGDSHLEDKKKQAKLVGGRVVEVMQRDAKYSTTKIIKKQK